ncbi:MAG: 2-deoxy-scyllo-inosamine dehydrogenase [Candidatus Hydrogenedentota bacterium]
MPIPDTAMRALEFNDGPRMIQTRRPRPQPGEAMLRITKAGICNTDLELARGYMGFKGIPGHEFVGVVEACENPALLGKRVVGEINCVCHQCDFCRRGMSHHCANRTVLGIFKRQGAFAEYVSLPEENLHLVPDAVDDETAVFTEPIAAAFRILEQFTISDSDRVIVLGDGKLAQLIAQVLWLRTKRLLCIGKHSWKLDLLQRLNIATALASDAVDPGADYVVEATGSETGLRRALELVRPQGVIVLKTTVAGETQADLSVPVINEITIAGSRCGPFKPALEALAMGNVAVKPLITHRFAFGEAVSALRQAAAPEAMKILLTF